MALVENTVLGAVALPEVGAGVADTRFYVVNLAAVFARESAP